MMMMMMMIRIIIALIAEVYHAVSCTVKKRLLQSDQPRKRQIDVIGADAEIAERKLKAAA